MTFLLPKPRRGTLALEREDKRAKADKIEREEKTAAKRRDGRCRWPSAHRCRFGLEAAHIRDASLQGPMHRDNLLALCGWIHRRGPESIHGKTLKVECETDRGARGACSFWRKGDDGIFYLVAREIAPFTYEKD